MYMNGVIHALVVFMASLMACLIASPLSAWRGRPWTSAYSSSFGPRAVCQVRNLDGLCVTWSYYGAAEVPVGETLDLITGGFAEKCYQAKRALKFQATTGDGGILFTCVKS